VEHIGVYFAFTEDAGALAAKSIKRVLEVYQLEDLGILEAVWVLEIKTFLLL